jgi:exopolysaccharide production protein ExoQ
LASTYFERVALFGFLVLASGVGMAAYLDPNDVEGGGGTILRVTYGLFYLLFFTLVVLRSRDAAAIVAGEKWLTIIWLWAVASTVWSVLPGQTFRRSFALLGTIIIGLYMGMKFSPKQQLQFIAACTGLGAIASLVAGLIFPHFGIVQTGEWIGVYYQKNDLGHTMAIGMFCFLFLMMGQRRGKATYITLAILCATLMVLSRSVTAMVVCALMLGVLRFRKLLVLPARSLVIYTGVFMAVAVPAAVVVFQNIDAVLGFFGRDASLTGRIPLWRIVLHEIYDRPILGYGFSAFWYSGEGDRVHAAIKWFPMHSHNGYLETTLALGIIGTTLLLIGLAASLLRGLRQARNAESIYDFWPVFFLIFMAVDNCTESWVLVPNALVWTLYVANTYLLARTKLEAAATTEPESQPYGALGALQET